MLQLNWGDVQGGMRMFKVIEGGRGQAVQMADRFEEVGLAGRMCAGRPHGG